MNVAFKDRTTGLLDRSRSDGQLVQRPDVMTIRMWGTRGSLPVSGSQFSVYGGATTSIEVRVGDKVLIFDAGSGIAPAGLELIAEGPSNVNLFLSHSHYDHIIGLPFFKPLYDPRSTVRLWSGHMHGQMTTKEIVSEFMRPPYFPVCPDFCKGKLDYCDFASGDVLQPVDGIRIITGSLNHPGGAVGYRIEWSGRVFAIITDTEHEPGTLDQNVLDLIRDADLFMYDACHTDAEMEKYKGFGHSSWQQAIRLAKAANAKSVGLMHHAPWRTDDDLAAIERLASSEFSGAFAARDGQIVTLKARR